MTKKIAVVLFNLGGPDSPDAVQPFLFNLFNDPAIISLPNPFRWLVAKMISKRRAPVAKEIYEHLGGSSPLLGLTQEQADALANSLNASGLVEAKVVIAMRYWHPFADEAVRDVTAFDPDEIILLPLYPQFSATTSGSSIKDWSEKAKAAGLTKQTKAVCCYPTDQGLVKAQVSLIRKTLADIPEGQKVRVLFSAHGLPKKVVEGGDPYQWQVEQTSNAVAQALAIDGLDWVVCYQSRVGPLEWIGPSTEDEIKRAADDKVALVIIPIAFVSEHSETLVELDIEYRELADDVGVPGYYRVPAVGTQSDFIQGLSDIVLQTVNGSCAIGCGHSASAICPKGFGNCPNKAA